MSYNLLAESSGRLSWRELHDAAVPGLSLVELFPVPGDGAEQPDALGIAVPARHATPQAWAELEALFERLRPFGLSIVELNTGTRVSSSTLSQIRATFLGPGG